MLGLEDMKKIVYGGLVREKETGTFSFSRMTEKQYGHFTREEDARFLVRIDVYKRQLVGYTEQSAGKQIEENDFEIIRQILEMVNHPVIAEGNINTPQKARRVLEIGCYSVVVGSIITRPQVITRTFTEEIDKLAMAQE